MKDLRTELYIVQLEFVIIS